MMALQLIYPGSEICSGLSSFSVSSPFSFSSFCPIPAHQLQHSQQLLSEITHGKMN